MRVELIIGLPAPGLSALAPEVLTGIGLVSTCAM
jgi:hypothetical protein